MNEDIVILNLTEKQLSDIRNGRYADFIKDICVFYELKVRRADKKIKKITHFLNTDKKEEIVIFNMENN